MRSRTLVCLAGALALAVVGCKGEPRPADAEQAAPIEAAPPRSIRVYSHNLPTCPHEELGAVTSSAEGEPAVRLAALQQQARDLGGDALIDLRESAAAGEVPSGTLTARVVRFTDPGCTEAPSP